MATQNIVADRVRQLLDYDKGSGLFRWRERTSNRIKVGALAGSRHSAGYIQINLDGSNFLAHRLAWLHVTGMWPKYHVDHINGDRLDNRWENLRDIPQSLNNQNIRNPSVRSSSGKLGVSWSDKDHVWIASISQNNRAKYIGAFDSAEKAYAAYISEKRRIHEACTI